RLKTAVAQAIVTHGASILEISTELQALSERAEAEIGPELRVWGVELLAFRILSINVPAEDESLKMLKQAKATAARRRIEGTSYPQERSYDVLDGVASNPGTGGITGPAVSLGVGLGAAKAVAGMMENVASNVTPPPFNAGAEPKSSYFVHVNGKQEGPYAMAAVMEKISAGDVQATTPMWRDGLPQWVVAGEIPELRGFFPPPFTPTS
ncbi:MAG TPA: SPFH domain-containing protein, partial [Thermoanaerobaculia bacterium]|nr:SPFH domain-containing protein [Thermoanaerobaculia bacterium]